MKTKLLLCLVLVLGGGLSGCSTALQNSSAHAGTGKDNEFLLSFPNRLKPGERVVGFGLHVQNGTILAVNSVPGDWVIDLCAEAPGSDMTGFPNDGASAFSDMAQLQRFVTVRKDRSSFAITGYLVFTKNFEDEWTNFLTKTDFALEETPKTFQPVIH
jgi:hypothetical protein